MSPSRTQTYDIEMGAHPVKGMAHFGFAVLAAAIGAEPSRRLRHRLLSRHRDLERSAAAQAAVRPIETVASDVRRLGRRFESVPARLPFARFEALRQAYDAVLAEACRALDIDHLLEVLPPGPELDSERRRVEAALARAGLRLDDGW